MGTRHANRTVTFTVVADDLVRTVTFSDGKRYRHSCPRASFEQVAYHLDQVRGGTMPAVHNATGLPFTQVDVALDFMRERGCITKDGRRSHPASRALVEDALTEWHALAAATQ